MIGDDHVTGQAGDEAVLSSKAFLLGEKLVGLQAIVIKVS